MVNQKSFRKFKKEPMILSVALFLAAAAAFIFLYSRINKNITLATLAESKWQEEIGRREGIKSVDRLLKEIEPQKVALESHFARGSNAVPFLDSLEKLARGAGTEPEITMVDVAKDDPGLLVELTAKGTFEAVYKLLLLLENSNYELRITAVDFSREAEGIWNGVFKIKLISFIPE